MNDAASKLRILRAILAPVLDLAADMSELTGRDETLAVLEALAVEPSADLAVYKIGNRLDKARFSRAAA